MPCHPVLLVLCGMLPQPAAHDMPAQHWLSNCSQVFCKLAQQLYLDLGHWWYIAWFFQELVLVQRKAPFADAMELNIRDTTQGKQRLMQQRVVEPEQGLNLVRCRITQPWASNAAGFIVDPHATTNKKAPETLAFHWCPGQQLGGRLHEYMLTRGPHLNCCQRPFQLHSGRDISGKKHP